MCFGPFFQIVEYSPLYPVGQFYGVEFGPGLECRVCSVGLKIELCSVDGLVAFMLALAWAACIFSNSANMLWRDVSTCFPAYFSAAALTSATSLIAAVASFFASRRTSRTNPAFIRSLCKMLKTLSGKVLIAWVRYWLYSVLTAGVNSASVDFGPTGACGAAWGVSLNDRRCCARWAAIASAMIFPSTLLL